MIYRRIDGAIFKNIYVVGDLHGCYDLLMKNLQEIKFNQETDLLISVGDLIDRGSQNMECLRLVNEKWFAMVRGNHDQMAIDGLIHNDLDMLHCWIYNGGDWFFKETEENQSEVIDLLKLIQKQPLIIELILPDEQKAVIAHADYPCNQYKFDQVVEQKLVQWNRERLESSGEINIEGADFFIFGHTILEEPTKLGNRFYIDLGAFRTGELCFLKLKENANE